MTNTKVGTSLAVAIFLLPPIISGGETERPITEGGEAVQDSLAEALEAQARLVDRFLGQTYRSYDHASADPYEYVKHPINAYLLMKRVTVQWGGFMEQMAGVRKRMGASGTDAADAVQSAEPDGELSKSMCPNKPDTFFSLSFGLTK